MRVELQEAVAQVPADAGEHHCDAQQVEEGASLAAVPVLREAYESDLRLTLSARAGLVGVGVAPVVPMFCPTCLCLLW
jgi:hypothetical protein